MITHTKGGLIIEEIKIGDIHYEYDYGMGMKCEVITLPKLNESSQYEWNSRNVNTGNIINYLVDPKYPHYSPNLYNHEAYKVNTYI
jgi:hypothetical protein